MLKGLGFTPDDFNKNTETFSGGWRMRIELAKVLLQEFDVLLLDEPTNHLDIDSIIWFEKFLKGFKGAVILVSHDKMFLDETTNRTVEITPSRAFDYKKAYSDFMALRSELIEQQLKAQRNQEKEIAQTEKLIERFRAKATKASMAQSLIKKLDKIDRIEVDEQETAVMHLNFPVSVTPGKVVLELESIVKNYGEKEVLKGIDLNVDRGNKIAFVGQNGQGKSTLAKIITNEIPHEGSVALGHNVTIGYFAQNQAEQLDGELTILDTMYTVSHDKKDTEVKSVLGAFLFGGDTVDKKIKVLSGGERNRVALAKLLLQPFNVLVMDEPTNHLDIQSKDVLKQALERFEGTLILVSHDRDFLRGLTDVVYEFKDGGIVEHLGDVEAFLKKQQAADFRQIEQKAAESTTKQEKKPQASYQDQKQIKKLKNKLSSVERKIATLEKDIASMDAQIAKDGGSDEVFAQYQKLQDDLSMAMEEWETVEMQLDELNS